MVDCVLGDILVRLPFLVRWELALALALIRWMLVLR